MTGAAWAIVILQGIAIVGLVLLYWRTRDERDAARGCDGMIRVVAAEPIRAGQLVAVVDNAFVTPPAMPATDRRVLVEMGLRTLEPTVWDNAEIASAAGVKASSVARVIRRLSAAGFIRRFDDAAGERLEGWVVTPEGRTQGQSGIEGAR